MIMLLSEPGTYIGALVSIATCAIMVLSHRYFCAKLNQRKQQALSDLPPGAVPLNEYLDSLNNVLAAKPANTMTPLAGNIQEPSPTKKFTLSTDISMSLLSSAGTTPELIATRMEKESERKVSSGKFKRRWSSGQFTELNI